VSRRTVVTLAVVVTVATVGVLFAQGARAADRHRRAQEIVARESSLYRQLANQNAVLESQRRIYVERFRRLESLLRQREDDVAVLRERLSTMRSLRINETEPRVIARQVHGPNSAPFTGGQER
jgi:hypothetical protein